MLSNQRGLKSQRLRPHHGSPAPPSWPVGPSTATSSTAVASAVGPAAAAKATLGIDCAPEGLLESSTSPLNRTCVRSLDVYWDPSEVGNARIGTVAATVATARVFAEEYVDGYSSIEVDGGISFVQMFSHTGPFTMSDPAGSQPIKTKTGIMRHMGERPKAGALLKAVKVGDDARFVTLSLDLCCKSTASTQRVFHVIHLGNAGKIENLAVYSPSSDGTAAEAVTENFINRYIEALNLAQCDGGLAAVDLFTDDDGGVCLRDPVGSLPMTTKADIRHHMAGLPRCRSELTTAITCEDARHVAFEVEVEILEGRPARLTVIYVATLSGQNAASLEADSQPQISVPPGPAPLASRAVLLRQIAERRRGIDSIRASVTLLEQRLSALEAPNVTSLRGLPPSCLKADLSTPRMSPCTSMQEVNSGENRQRNPRTSFEPSPPNDPGTNALNSVDDDRCCSDGDRHLLGHLPQQNRCSQAISDLIKTRGQEREGVMLGAMKAKLQELAADNKELKEELRAAEEEVMSAEVWRRDHLERGSACDANQDAYAERQLRDAGPQRGGMSDSPASPVRVTKLKTPRDSASLRALTKG